MTPPCNSARVREKGLQFCRCTTWVLYHEHFVVVFKRKRESSDLARGQNKTGLSRTLGHFLSPFILCQHCNKQTALWCRREISPAYVSPDSLARPPLSSLSDEDSQHESSPTPAVAMSDEEITFNFSRQKAGQLQKPCGMYSVWWEGLLKSENFVFCTLCVCACTCVYVQQGVTDYYLMLGPHF